MIKKLLTVILVITISSCGNISSSYKIGENNIPKNGIINSYNEDGVLSTSVQYKNNRRNGLTRDYYTDGKLRAEINKIKSIHFIIFICTICS